MELYILPFKENLLGEDFNGGFKYRMKFKFYIYIKIMRCEIVNN